MSEAMSVDRYEVFEDDPESIVDFVEKNSNNEKIKALYDSWETVCTSLQIDLTYIRWKLDKWFQHCYHACKEVRKLSNEVSQEMALKRKEDLFEEFKTEIEDVIKKQKEDFINKLKIEAAKEEIFKNYEHNPEDWIDRANECVEKEIELMAEFKRVKIAKEKTEANQRIEREITEAKLLRKNISKCLEKMSNEVTNWNQYYNKKEESSQNLDRLQEYLDQVAKNGVVTEIKQLKLTIRDCETHLEKAQNQIVSNKQEVIRIFDKLYQLLENLVKELIETVQDWKNEFKFQYVELVASPNLTGISSWCAQTGRMIYDLINESLVSWENILLSTESDQSGLQRYQELFSQLLTDLLQSTFVVTEQESCIIKVDKKHLPRIVVRMLAAEDFPERLETITAKFAFEEDINMCCHENCIELSQLWDRINDRGIHLMSNIFKFDNGKKRDKRNASFQTLHFQSKFNRLGVQTGKQVHEEKSRIIFITTLHNQDYMAMSLPLVVTTGANQGCLSQASVMWQCFSTDVYQLPIPECQPLPWCQVAEMLQAKMQKLCSMRLTPENVNHLKTRLFGRSDVPDEELVTLKKFCFDKLEKTDGNEDSTSCTQLTFSFWKWFIGIYNLLDKYLLNFWKDGLIMGFISKEEAKAKLKRCRNGRSGTFLLRFSDQNITDSQGVKSVFGHLTACVLIIKEEIDGRKKKKIFDMDVAGHKKLKEKNLANILKATMEAKSGKIYQYLYPGDKTREETFDKYCDKDAVVAGYTGIRDAFVVHLDQQFAALEITCGKHARSPSVDSGIETVDISSPLNSSLSFNGPVVNAAKIKRPRVSSSHPTIAKMLQQGQTDGQNQPGISFAVPSPLHNGQSPYYLGQSPAHQAMSPNIYSQTPSPAFSTSTYSQDATGSPFPIQIPGHQQSDTSEQGSPKFSSLPTVVEDMDPMNKASNTPIVAPVLRTSSSCPNDSYPAIISPQGTVNESTYTVNSDGDVQIVSFESGSSEVVVVQQLSDHSSMESSISDHSSVSNYQVNNVTALSQTENPYMESLDNNTFRVREPVTSTVSEHQQEIYMGLQSNPDLLQIMNVLNSASPEVIRSLQNYFSQNVASAANTDIPLMTTGHLVSTCPVVMATSGTPTMTSSGSMSDAFNFSPTEIEEGQEMNSGTIDTSVFASVDSSGGGIMS